MSLGDEEDVDLCLGGGRRVRSGMAEVRAWMCQFLSRPPLRQLSRCLLRHHRLPPPPPLLLPILLQLLNRL